MTGEVEKVGGKVEKAKPGEKVKERPDPTEWRPRDNRDWERAQANVSAQHMRSEPLRYQSLAGVAPEDIAGIEATARGDLIRMMERQGLYPDERGIRVQWAMVVDGYGFQMPEGFVHPEAPDEMKREGVAAWKRCVEMASDSMSKFIYAMVWRRRQKVLESTKPIALPGKDDASFTPVDEAVEDA